MSVSQFPYMDDLASLCDDVEPLPKWREEMLAAVRYSRNHFPDDYRNRELNDPCFEAAREEFAAVKDSANQDENTSVAL